jgi:hypothetical protein
MRGRDVTYEVGFAKPPKSGQFERGKSGNPKGRPKGSKNFATVVLRECRQRVRVNGPRGTRTVTKLEAAVMQLGNKAAQGDLRSQREFFSLVRVSEEAANLGVSTVIPHEIDQKVMQDILRRMERISADATSTNPKTKTEES